MITVEKLNEVYLHVTSTPDVEMELSEHFKFFIHNAKYMPSFKNGLFDGYLRLYSAYKKTLYVGLLPYLLEFAKGNDYPIDVKFKTDLVNIDYKFIEHFVSLLDIHSKNCKIEMRDYQIETVLQALQKKRLIVNSPTSSGKSAAIYTLIRYLLTKKLRILLVTPRASLVEQMYTDFQDYSSHNDWNTEENCHRLYSGRPKFFTKPVTITTWQSIYKHPPQWFSQQSWDVVIVDECHTAVAASLTGILEKLPNTPYRVGLSGTTANTKTARLILEGLFGSIYTAITTKQLMDRDQIVNLKIKSLILKHPNEDCQVFHTIDYHTEMSFLIKNHQRNKFIVNLAKATKGNTLILSNYVTDHCDVLIDMLEQNTTKHVYRITGEVKVVTREGIRTKLEEETNTILVGTYGAISMGVNIPSIQNIIFASPTKSMIRTLQSIGRGLRLNNDKTHCNVFDITDDLSWKTKKTLKRNHTLRHGIERFRIYMNEQFNVKIINVNLGQYQS